MEQGLTDMANEVFPAGPDRIAPYPADGQQRVLAALRQDVEAGRHLLCVTGAAGSGKTVVLRSLKQSLTQGLTGLIERPMPGALLRDVARALQLDAPDEENESVLRRRLVMLLSMADQRQQTIVQIVDDADSLSREDIDLLLHFFPPGHATLVLAGRAPPESWLAGCSTPSGPLQVVGDYRLDPLSADETAAYIRHRLSAARLPDDLFQPDAVEAIHRQSGGLPGRINKLSAEVLAQSAAQGEDSVSVPVVEQVSSMVRPASEEGGDTEAATAAPLLARRRRTVLPVRSLVAPSEAHYVGGSRPQPVRRLQRRVRRWRAVAILASIALATVLIRDVWTGQMGSARVLLDDLAELITEHAAPVLTSLKPSRRQDAGESDAPAVSADAMGRSSDFAALSAPSSPPEDAEYPALPGETAPEKPETAAPPQESARDAEVDIPADASMAQAVESVDREDAIAPGEKTAAPDSGGSPEPEPEPETSAESVPETATDTPAKESSTLTRDQRERIARLYAKRAEYEWRNGDLAAASVSIQRGLSNDPGNPRLLAMRARLREALR